MTARVVSLTKEAYIELKNAMPPDCRFTNVEEWGFNHIWVYAPNGDPIIFTPSKIEFLPGRKLEGFPL